MRTRRSRCCAALLSLSLLCGGCADVLKAGFMSGLQSVVTTAVISVVAGVLLPDAAPTE